MGLRETLALSNEPSVIAHCIEKRPAVCALAPGNDADKLCRKRTPCPNSHAFTASAFGCSPSLPSAITPRISTPTMASMSPSFPFRPSPSLSASPPQRQQRLVEAWAELHEEELLADWALLEQGRKPSPIKPLV